jgi:hypothetical protein
MPNKTRRYSDDSSHSDEDQGVALREYVNWMASKYPQRSTEYEKAYSILNDNFYELSQIQDLGTNDWLTLAIPPGIGAQLSHNTTKFWKAPERSKDDQQRRDAEGVMQKSAAPVILPGNSLPETRPKGPLEAQSVLDSSPPKPQAACKGHTKGIIDLSDDDLEIDAIIDRSDNLTNNLALL